MRISFLLPTGNIGDLMGMCSERRGVYVRTEYLSPTRAILVYEMPLAEIIYDLYDKLKSVTHGYGTMDYDILGYRAADLVRLDVLVHHKSPLDALSNGIGCPLSHRRPGAGEGCSRSCARRSIATCSRWCCRPLLGVGSSPERTSPR